MGEDEDDQHLGAGKCRRSVGPQGKALCFRTRGQLLSLFGGLVWWYGGWCSFLPVTRGFKSATHQSKPPLPEVLRLVWHKKTVWGHCSDSLCRRATRISMNNPMLKYIKHPWRKSRRAGKPETVRENRGSTWCLDPRSKQTRQVSIEPWISTFGGSFQTGPVFRSPAQKFITFW